MPSFGNPFSGLSLDRPLSKEELIRAIRFMAAAEFEAIEMYSRVSDATQDEKIKKAIESVTEEERIHAGEFLKMLTILDPEEAKLYQEGFKEVEENVGKQAMSDYIRLAAQKISKYEWQETEKGDAKTLMYESPYTGKKFHVSPSASDKEAATFKEIREKIFDHLRKEDWKIQEKSTKAPWPELKIPYVISPDGRTKLWFKAQAVYEGPTFESAHSVITDIREYADPKKFINKVE